MGEIVALFSPRGTVAPGDIERATEQLVRRGPDGQRQWMAPHGRVGTRPRAPQHHRPGDRRPADRHRGRTRSGSSSTASSTTSSASSASWCAGPPLRTRSDSEIALHLYEDLGRGCLEQLRGEFAFALWDGPNQLLFAARDRFGIKPLFYAQHGGTLYLASEVKALFAPASRALGSRDDLPRQHRRRTADATLYRRRLAGAARPLPAGDRGYTHAAPLLGLPVSRVDPTAGPSRGRRVRRAVPPRAGRGGPASPARRRPVGCYLSGGLDSCTVLGLASQHLARSDPRVHARVRPGRLRRERDREEMAEKRGRRVLPDSDPAGRSRRSFRRRDLARRNALFQRARRREVRA